MNSKLPHECADITEVRNEIDRVDHEIIQLLAKRLEYVREVVKYKDNTATAIEANERRMEVLRSRRDWAEQAGVNADAVEKVYNTLVEYFIEEEKKLINV